MAGKKRRWTWFDALIVLLVLFFGARFLYLHYGPGKAIGRQLGPVKVQILLADLRGPEVAALRAGDQLTNSHTNTPLGTVLAVQSFPVRVWKGGAVGDSPDFRDLYVTVQGQGQLTPVATVLGTTQIHIGTVVPVASPFFADDNGLIWKIYSHPPGGAGAGQ